MSFFQQISVGRTSQIRGARSVFVVVQSLIHVQLFATPWTAARQASLSFTLSKVQCYIRNKYRVQLRDDIAGPFAKPSLGWQGWS